MFITCSGKHVEPLQVQLLTLLDNTISYYIVCSSGSYNLPVPFSARFPGPWVQVFFCRYIHCAALHLNGGGFLLQSATIANRSLLVVFCKGLQLLQREIYLMIYRDIKTNAQIVVRCYAGLVIAIVGSTTSIISVALNNYVGFSVPDMISSLLSKS